MNTAGQITLDFRPRSIEALGGTGILGPDDIKRLGAATMRVFELMKDGLWHSPEEIDEAAGSPGQPARNGLRRMRELRKYFDVELQKRPGTNQWDYRLVMGAE